MPSEARVSARMTGGQRTILDVHHTRCCIVGGGPAGAVLAYMLARRGIPVTLLEQHHDFDRDFRGDTLQPAAMELMDELGLADQLLALRHSKVRTLDVQTSAGPITIYDCSSLKTKFPYSTELAQVLFLNFITSEAKKFPNFELRMGAHIEEMIVENGVVQGVRYRSRDGWHEVRAPLTVGADGRFSRLRHLTGIKPKNTAPEIDVVWFRLPRRPEEPDVPFISLGWGNMIFGYAYPEHWRVGFVIQKGAYQQLRAAGLESLREHVTALAPMLADRVHLLTDWHQAPLLSVESNRIKRWYRPGLLLIGDAAHAMSPVGGIGTTYAIQDAVVAANVLASPLERQRLTLRDLQEVQRRRNWPVWFAQAFQARIQQRMMAGMGLDGSDQPPRPQLALKLPFVMQIATYLIAFGPWRVHVEV